ncbi:MAG: protein-L-isoaspartate O-methyltransferase [Methanobacterium sp. BRmetb2]|nr:MAG: protein-L-isoaspartate O-methyltransferase [Methanobacterium sp. BRmetb2]
MINERKNLVELLKSSGYIKTDKVKKAMETVPREEFIPEQVKQYAYVDQPLPIGEGQTISAPHMVAIICEELQIDEGMNILEIGTGFGYNAAVVAEIVGKNGHVYSIERLPALADTARDNLRRTGYSDRVSVIVADGTTGFEEEAPFDRIYVTAGAPDIPEPLKKQLKVGGKLLAPVGQSDYTQELFCVEKKVEGKYKVRSLGGVAFVPLIGKHGWPED